MIVSPGASFEATANWGSTGVTLGVRITDNQGATVVPRTTAGITEYPAGSGLYAKTLTAPGTAGQYSIVWDDGVNYADDELVVSGTGAAPIITGSLYYTAAELKASLEIVDDQLDDEIDLAVLTASRACDEYKSSFGHRVFFYPVSQTRYYQGIPGAERVDIDCLNTVSSVTVDTDGDGIHETTWVRGVDYVLEPTNAAADNRPYTSLRLLRQGARVFPMYDQSIKIIGSFGWAETPAQVKSAAKILAGRLFKRRETPFAFQVLVGDTMSAARIGRIDPDVQSLLDQVPPYPRPRSLQMR